ncbi:uncharacterized protein LOC113367916 [Ctenocephalides felis]|uniref:uncharacterized protein LOC113367916 n=1 Tax=Ctenocephalides felis TaxID=7515 RepID=UPI000E6E3761|nr:uncharacterized protein LOC113367916 [Ctenocephalides felis]
MYQLLLLAFLGAIKISALSSPCTLEEIRQPITNFKNLVEELESPDISKDRKLEQIRNLLDQVPNHYHMVNVTCGEEKILGLEDVKNFMDDGRKIYGIMDALGTEDLAKAKSLFGSIHSRRIMHYFITQIEFWTGKLNKIIQVTKLIDDVDVVNKMHAGIIFTLNETNFVHGQLLVPILKEHLFKYRDGGGKEVFQRAKQNLHNLAKRTGHHYPNALSVLNDFDKKLADKTIQNVVKRVFTNNIYSKAFDVITEAPTIRLAAMGLKALQKKINSMNLQNSLVAAKLFVWNIMNLYMYGNREFLAISNSIMNNTTDFSKQLLLADSCHKLDEVEVEALYSGQPVRPRSHTGQFIDDMDLAGTIVSNQTMGYFGITPESICRASLTPEYYTCMIMQKFLSYSYEKIIVEINEGFKTLKDQIKSCLNQEQLVMQCLKGYN